ncbi:unnamed protein product [Rangifer tarandus platyrhynchus]|uniref:Uncharacterized protein n=1 Tax=Rangifer tarandus platyrhynchus TaxID=3082113 RepID=A0ACB1KHN1_RANTA
MGASPIFVCGQVLAGSLPPCIAREEQVWLHMGICVFYFNLCILLLLLRGIRGCRTKENMLEVYRNVVRDLTYLDSCKNQGFQPGRVCTSSHTISPFCIEEA